MNLNVKKDTFGHVRPAKIQIRLRIRAVWSESSLGAVWLAKPAKFLHADNEDSDQTAQIRFLHSCDFTDVEKQIPSPGLLSSYLTTYQQLKSFLRWYIGFRYNIDPIYI